MIQNQATACPSDQELAAAFDEIGKLLEQQGANPFRVRAYHRAAATIRGLQRPLREILATGGVRKLMELPGIGRSLAHSIEQWVECGRLPLLQRLRGEDVAERVFATVPDIGAGMAQRIHETLGIETLPELEAAAYDGRLAQVPGMGQKRIRAVRESLAGRFAHRRQSPPPPRPAVGQQAPAADQQAPAAGQQAPAADQQAPVEEILDVDAQYRRLAEQGKLPRIAPRRFNPTHEAWLPVLHTQRGPRRYTALYSNTARAHELNATHDWVVIYRDDDQNHGRWTVITANYGRLRGCRIVRGRERECESGRLF